ncbi:MAG: hypothetical protein RSD49_01480 [Hafnia sp.]
MDNHTITAFQATQQVCLNLIKEDFEYATGGYGKRSCVWEKTLNQVEDKLQIYIIENQISMCDLIEAEPISFEVHIKINGSLNIQVVRHGLTFAGFAEALPKLIGMVNHMIEQFRQTHNMGEQQHERSIVG